MAEFEGSVNARFAETNAKIEAMPSAAHLWAIIGTTAGMRLVASIEADLLAQTVATVRPLVAFDKATEAFDFWATVGAVTSVVGVLSVLTYFFFSVEHKGAVGATARLGVWFLMITFGSAFGLTVMGRITLLAQRFEFLFKEWLGIV